MSLNIKRLEVTVPFNLSDLNGDSSFKVFFDFVKSIEALAEKNKDLCEVVEQKVTVKDLEAYEELTNIKNKNKDLLDKDLLKKEKELFSKNIYEGSVSLLYNINFDNEIIKEYAQLQGKLSKLKTVSTVKVQNFYDPKRVLLESFLSLKKYRINNMSLLTAKDSKGVYKTNFSYSVPIDERGSYPKSFAVLKKNIKRKLILNYDYPIVLENKKNFKDDINVSFDFNTNDIKDIDSGMFISSFQLDESNYSDGPISKAKKEIGNIEFGKSFSLDDEIVKFYFNCVSNKCESFNINSTLEDDFYNTRISLKIKEKDLSKFTQIIDHCANNLEEQEVLVERKVIGPDPNGDVEYIIGIHEKNQNRPTVSF